MIASLAEAQGVTTEDVRINAWFNAKFEEQLDFSPMGRSYMGDKKAYDKVDEPADMDAYIARIKGLSRALLQRLETAKLNAAAGSRPLRFAYDGAIKQGYALIAGAPFDGVGDNSVWTDAQAKADALVKAGKIDQTQADRYKAAARKALLEDWGPAYRQIIGWLEADRSNTDVVATGVGKNPNGKAYYAERLFESTTTADRIHRIGLSEVARIKGKMEAIKQQVGFKASLRALFKFVRNGGWSFTDPARFVPAYIVFVGLTGIVSATARGLGEEIGWRGFLTSHLHARFGYTGGTLVTGVIWTLWHVPLILFANYNNGAPSVFALTCFFIMVMNLSFIMTWLRLRSGSVWPCAILHGSHNLFIQQIFTPLTSPRGSLTAYAIDEFGFMIPAVTFVVALVCWLYRDRAIAADRALESL